MWHLLSAFYLDNQLTPEHLSNIAVRCAESKYTIAELDVIMFRDLFPALVQNLWAPAGEWLPWSEEFVAMRVLKYRHEPTPVRWWQFVTWRSWARLKRQVRRIRRAQSVAASDSPPGRTRGT